MKQNIIDIVFFFLPRFVKIGLCSKALKTQSFSRLEVYCLIREATYMVDISNDKLEVSVELDIYSKRYKIYKTVFITEINK